MNTLTRFLFSVSYALNFACLYIAYYFVGVREYFHGVREEDAQ